MASYVGERSDQDFTQFPSPVVTLPAYTKIDFAAGHDFVRSASGRSSMGLTLRVDNVLDRRYEDVLNFPAPGRTFLVGARIRGAM
jgi:outer membrane cobalamin receptor